MSTKKEKPVRTLRDGLLKAVIWRNEGEKGPFYSVQLLRAYQDDQETWHDVNSFSGGDILRIAHLTGHAYDAIAKLRGEDRAQEAGA
ncbi:MAG: hypothetical protein AAFQ84_07730 [Pseudomonadota bacterium]